MVWFDVRMCAVLEVTVILFQVFGVAALCLNRLLPASRWADRGRIGAIVAVFGLAIAGALCNRHCSEFALFAGGTMTVLLIGMTIGTGASRADSGGETAGLIAPEPNLAG
jgi:uncharacterized membrane protein YhaH (DUF805 family)